MDIQDLNPVFAQKLQAMLDAAKGQGINPGNIISGYRSVPQQAEIYARSHQGRDFMAAPPGGSMHNFGLATDISSPDIQKLRSFANAHPELGIYPLPGDTPHFQLAGNQHALMANPPTLPSGTSYDVMKSLGPYADPKQILNAGLAQAAPSTAIPPAPDAYGYASSTPNAVPGTTINSIPSAAPTAVAGGTPLPATAAPAAPAPSIANLIGQGNFGGALASAGQNKGLMGSIGDLSKAMGSGGDSSKGAPSPPPMPQMQDNSAAIAQMAPQMLAALMAKQNQLNPLQRRPVPGLSLGGYSG